MQSERIEANRRAYERLLKDDNYADVRFNPTNGALSAIHKDHFFDPTIGRFGVPRGDYERISTEILYKYGYSIILCSEKYGYKVKNPEGYLNGKLFDIKSVEGTGKNNVINNFKGASKKGVESIVLYYHDKSVFSEKQLREGYQFYLRNSQSKQIQFVYYIMNNKLHTL